MTLYSLIFYVVAAVIVASTAVAITRRNLVHAVVYLIFSYFGTALLFFLFGAPLLAAFEVIIYAGAIMVLFLFVVMMIRIEEHEEILFPLSQWVPAGVFGTVYLVAGTALMLRAPGTGGRLHLLLARPRDFALFVFKEHWLSIEIVSLLLLVALVAALHLGKGKNGERVEEQG